MMFMRCPNSNSTRNQVDEEPLCGCATSKLLFNYLFYFIHIFIQRYSVGTLLILVRCMKHSAVYKLENGRCDRLVFILILWKAEPNYCSRSLVFRFGICDINYAVLIHRPACGQTHG